MYLNDSMLLELLFIIALFGALPVAYVTRSKDEGYKTFGFVLAFVTICAVLGFIGQVWPLFIFVPMSWWFALEPIIKKRKG